MNDYAYHLWTRIGGAWFNRTRTPENGLFARLWLLAKRLVAAARRHHHRQATIRVLRGLSDWQLADIGIERGQIPLVVDGLLAKQENQRSRRPLPGKDGIGKVADLACTSPC